MKSLGDFDYSFADRLRGIRYSGTGPDNKTYCDWLDEAADLLDECETLIGAMRQEIQNLGGSLEGVITADATLVKLRAQEKADG